MFPSIIEVQFCTQSSSSNAATGAACQQPARTASIPPPKASDVAYDTGMPRPQESYKRLRTSHTVLPSFSRCGEAFQPSHHGLISFQYRPSRTKLRAVQRLHTAAPYNVRVLTRGMLRCLHSLLLHYRCCSPLHRRTAWQIDRSEVVLCLATRCPRTAGSYVTLTSESASSCEPTTAKNTSIPPKITRRATRNLWTKG